MDSDRGFSLIELLVVITIIGIIAAIAIPQFSVYKSRAFNARAASDLRNALTAQEAYFVDREEYADCQGAACGTMLPGFILSDGVDVDTAPRGTEEFAAAACHEQGSRIFQYRSDPEGFSDIAMGPVCVATAP